MFKIAVCDDEINICKKIKKTILEYSKTIFAEVQVKTFCSGEELCSFIEVKHGFNLIYLDIELELMNGIEVGKYIRKKLNDYKTEIVYISGKDSYDRQLFDVQPLHFIQKPIYPKFVITTLNLAMKRIKNLNYIFTYKKEAKIYKALIEDILYFESRNKKIKINKTSSEDVFYGKLQDVFEETAKYQFINIHKSYLVNYLHVSVFKYDEVIMSNNVHLPISQSRRKEVRKTILNWEIKERID